MAVCYHYDRGGKMANFEIVIDNVAVFLSENDARPEAVLPISFLIDGKVLKTLDRQVVFSAHQDERAVRTQIVPKDSTLALEKLLDTGKDLLVISVSSGLSESFAAAEYIVKGLRIKHPERKILLVDSLSCGGGEGLLFALAKKWQAEGLDVEQVAEKLEEVKSRLHHVFFTPDTSLLSIGNVLQTSIVNIKPIFDIALSGKACVLQKTMGKKKALSDIVKYVSSTIATDICPTVLITSGVDTDAKVLGDGIKAQVEGVNVVYAKENDFVLTYLGEDAVTVCFFGELRK